MANRKLTLSLSVPSTASTTTAGNPTYGFGRAQALKFVASLVGLTGGTLDVYIQHSMDGGTTWYDCVHFAQLAAGAAAVKIDGQTPGLDSTLRTVGSGTTPALAASTVVPGPWGDQLRLLAVTGSGTSGAAAAISVDVLAWDGVGTST